MKLFPTLSLATLGLVVLLQAQGQKTAQPDPYRNFVGHWSGVIKVNPMPHTPSQVELTITESPDGKKMTWNYIFGTRGQPGYDQIVKTIIFQPAKEQMTTRWKGEDAQAFATEGLAAFTDTGYGKFTAIDISDPKAIFHSNKTPTNRVTFDLQPSAMSYLWETTKNGVSSTYSYFIFQRTEKTQ